jgi:hypothetical protein
MKSSLVDIDFPDIKAEKARIPSSNHISFFNNLTIMDSVRYDSHVQV